MLEEKFPRQIFLVLAWLPEEMKLVCITLSLCHDCSASTKLNSVVIFKIVRSCNRPVQHSAHHGRQLPKSLILLPAEEKSGWLGSAGSSCQPHWTSTGWPPCMRASPEQHLLGHSPSSGQATVAKSLEKTTRNTEAEELKGSEASNYEDTERLEGTIAEGTAAWQTWVYRTSRDIHQSKPVFISSGVSRNDLYLLVFSLNLSQSTLLNFSSQTHLCLLLCTNPHTSTRSYR